MRTPINRTEIRNYSLYAIKLSNNKYYVGLTAYKDPYRRIKQHGGTVGARINFGSKVVQVMEIRNIGKMPRFIAENLENDMTNEYMDKHGMRNVRGGRMTRRGWLFLRSYNPGSAKWIIQTLYLILLLFLTILLCFFVITQTK